MSDVPSRVIKRGVKITTGYDLEAVEAKDNGGYLIRETAEEGTPGVFSRAINITSIVAFWLEVTSDSSPELEIRSDLTDFPEEGDEATAEMVVRRRVAKAAVKDTMGRESDWESTAFTTMMDGIKIVRSDGSDIDYKFDPPT